MADYIINLEQAPQYIINLTTEQGPAGAGSLPEIANNRIVGNVSGSTAAAYGLTAAEVKTLLAIGASDVTGVEPTITAGTTAQYWRGDKSWATLNQAAVSGLTTSDSPTFAGLTSPTLILGSTGPLIKASSGTFQFKNNADNAYAPITTANITAGNFVVDATNSNFGMYPYVGFGNTWGIAIAANKNIEWSSTNDYTLTKDAKILRGGTGLVQVQAGNGLALKNLAATTYSPLQCGNSSTNVAPITINTVTNTVDAFKILDDSPVTRFSISGTGDVVLYTSPGGVSGTISPDSIYGGVVFTVPSSNNKVTQIRGAASQTENLTEWQDNASTVLASISASGLFSCAGITNSGSFRTTTFGSYVGVLSGNRFVFPSTGIEGYSPDGTQMFTITNFGVLSKSLVEANTDGSGSPNTLLSTESSTILTNEGATAENYHALVSAAAGYEFEFICQDSDGIRIVANTGDTIRDNEVVSTTAGYIRSAVVGSVIRLRAINATEWFVVYKSGHWSIDTTDAALVTKTGAYTITPRVKTVLADATSAAFPVTLPTAVGCATRQHNIKKIDSTSNAITIATTSSQTIDGLTTRTLTVQNQSMTVESDGSNWRIV